MVNGTLVVCESSKSNVNNINQFDMKRRKTAKIGLNPAFSLMQWSDFLYRVSSQTRKPILLQDFHNKDQKRQIRKLNDSVPEDEVEPTATKEGYVAYGSYAQSVIARKENLRETLSAITEQTSELSADLRVALDALDSFERVRARQMAAKAEKAMARKAG